MKRLFFLVLAVFAVILPAALPSSEGSPQTKVIAYYFHGSFRCVTCHRLEEYAKEAIEAGFENELGSGRLEFKVVNVEDRGNEHYASDYQLYTRSLILSLVKDGRQVKWKNLDKIWEYVGNKQKYFDYVKSETEAFLKETR